MLHSLALQYVLSVSNFFKRVIFLPTVYLEVWNPELKLHENVEAAKSEKISVLLAVRK